MKHQVASKKPVLLASHMMTWYIEETPWVDEATKKAKKANLTRIPLKLHQNLGEVIRESHANRMAKYYRFVNMNSFGRFFVEASVMLNRDEEIHKDYAIL